MLHIYDAHPSVYIILFFGDVVMRHCFRGAVTVLLIGTSQIRGRIW